ncbi:MAG TPA: SulP family inorganic anion transporter [Bryobacteraceae bacterium]|nr:SulP family inorganic anion transporter [Bryobacteraceae bacterium]
MSISERKSWFRHDGPAGLVVFLVALPLCLGIALSSGAPPFAGVIAGVVGGIVVSTLSGSHVSVSGPAVALVAIVAGSIQTLGSYKAFLASVVLAGIFQLVLGILRAGSIADYVPNCVIRGMLAAIGIVIILKQIPHALGSDQDFEGDFSFFGNGTQNTFTDIVNSVPSASPGAVMIALVSLLILIAWDRLRRRVSLVKLFPGPVAAVLSGVALNQAFALWAPHFQMKEREHLVSLPVVQSASAFFAQFQAPDFSVLGNQAVWIAAITIALFASVETLLSLEAADRLDPYLRTSSPNRELFAQGTGNIVSGMLGGLPLASVVVRTSANVYAGGQTRWAAFTHGVLLFIAALFIPGVLNLVPLASLAAVLMAVGYKLTKVELYKTIFRDGYAQFLPFIVTVMAIVFTGLLTGVLVGLAVGLLFVILANHHDAITVVSQDRFCLMRFNKDATFVNKSEMRRRLRDVPDNTHLIIDGTKALYIDRDIFEAVEDFRKSASGRNIAIEYKHFDSTERPSTRI